MRAVFKKMSVIMLITALLAVCFCSCGETFTKKEDVKLKTVMETKDYIKKNLPGANYVKTEEESDDKVVYTFMDKECGFKFQVTSEKYRKEMEGVDLGYAEKTTDNWAKAYNEYIQSKLSEKEDELKESMGFEYEHYDGLDSDVFMAVFTDKPAGDIEASVRELADIIKEADKHKKLTDKEIWCWKGEKDDNYDNLTGCYLLAENKIVDKKTRDELVKDKDSSSK